MIAILVCMLLTEVMQSHDESSKYDNDSRMYYLTLRFELDDELETYVGPVYQRFELENTTPSLDIVPVVACVYIAKDEETKLNKGSRFTLQLFRRDLKWITGSDEGIGAIVVNAKSKTTKDLIPLGEESSN